MSIQFGRIRKFEQRGFGFIENDEKDVFFHIKVIKDTILKLKLENDFKEFDDIFIWFSYQKDIKGVFADFIWTDIKKVPPKMIAEYLKNYEEMNSLSNRLVYFKRSLKEIFMNINLYENNIEIDRSIKNILQKELFKTEPQKISKKIPDKYKTYYSEIIKLEELWTKENIPFWLTTTTEELIGNEKLAELKIKRENFLKLKIEEEEKAKEQRKKLSKQKRDEEEKLKQNLVKNLLLKYQSNSKGIRKERALSDICLKCGSAKVHSKNEKQHYYKVCQDCNSKWYVNHCWNCSANIDSRDIENPQCSKCNWYKCTCGACKYDGCVTNPYSKDNKLKDSVDFDESLIYDILDSTIPEKCDWCGNTNVTYKDEAFTLCENCSDQLFRV